MSKVACLFPFAKEALQLLRNGDLIKDYSLQYIGSYNGWINGFEDDIKQCGSNIVDIWDDSQCEMFDTVVVPKYSNDLKIIDDRIEKRLHEFQMQKKKVIKVTETYCDRTYYNSNILQSISACVILIVGIGSDTQKSELALELFRCFQADGLCAEVVSSYSEAPLLGFYSFPSFMYQKTIDEYQKMYAFNSYIKEIDKNNPDVIIVNVPCGVIPYLESEHESECNQGITHFIVSYAIQPDYICLGVYAKAYMKGEIEDIRNLANKRLFNEINSVVMSKFSIDWIAYNDVLVKDIQRFPVNQKVVNKCVKFTSEKVKDIEIYPIMDIEKLYHAILAHFALTEKNYMTI